MGCLIQFGFHASYAMLSCLDYYSLCCLPKLKLSFSRLCRISMSTIRIGDKILYAIWLSCVICPAKFLGLLSPCSNSGIPFTRPCRMSMTSIRIGDGMINAIWLLCVIILVKLLGLLLAFPNSDIPCGSPCRISASFIGIDGGV